MLSNVSMFKMTYKRLAIRGNMHYQEVEMTIQQGIIKWPIVVRLVLIFTITTVSAFQTHTVKTSIGIINGFVEDVSLSEKTDFLLPDGPSGTTVKLRKYFGIPFAEPPVGNRRFKKPDPKTPLTTPLNAFNHNKACFQVTPLKHGNAPTDEDCLYLNIYAPETLHNEKLAVMIWIYGGAFMHGFSDMYVADFLAIYGNVIVVTFNYRMSVWGFLSTGDENAPGNYGLWDQHLAIKWIHDNIAKFGGDTNRVTVFGESAGSASVIFQSLYPGNKALFQRAIAQSGSIGAFWSVNENTTQLARHLGTLADCETVDNKSLIDCLRDVPNHKLEEFVSDFSYGLVTLPSPFTPVNDGLFINYDQKHALDMENGLPVDAKEMFSSVDLMTGVNSGEGSIFVLPFFGVKDRENFLPNRTYFEEYLVSIFFNAVYGGTVPQSVRASIIAEYTNWKDPDNKYNVRDEFLSLWGDSVFGEGLYRTLNKHEALASNQKKTYMYFFDEEPDYRSGYVPMTWFKKLGHAEDIPFLFGFLSSNLANEYFKVTPSEWEEKLSRDIIRLWSNFAKTGNPNSPSETGINWIPYTKTNKTYLQITRNMTSENVKR
ncbi:cholinesterase 1-like [Ruditapes philippinarum]|uniref:cholinesterase 1-like n=1 Tax=Ruditapes philippinarum TaxID=129788 RepID=UPI00295B3513|nr:cholinesterase 1-like [Ruditapes philippinarum]